MNVSEALADIRAKIHDQDVIEMTDADLLTCLNEAIQFISSFIIEAKSPLLVNDMTISAETTTLPDNFVKTAGMYPVKVTGNTLKWLDYEEGRTMKLRYFASCTPVTANGVMPFTQAALHQIIIKVAAIYAGNELEADISQDKILSDEESAALARVIGGAV